MPVTNGGVVTVVSGLDPVLTRKSVTPAAPSATATKAALALTASPQAGVTAGITQPDVPRNMTIKGNASGNAGNVTIHGTNENDAVITETIALNGATEVVGNKAFKTVTSIDYPAETHAGTDTVSIGRGSKLGLGRTLRLNTVQDAYLNNVREAVAPTVATSATAVESNTVLLNSALPGAQQVDIDFRRG
jgi:hypothetical protein